MHDGCLNTLDDVLQFYVDGGKVKRPSLSREMRPVPLSAEERRGLLDFLATLTSDDALPTVPLLPR
jgi:cytochrome c peroxidase